MHIGGENKILIPLETHRNFASSKSTTEQQENNDKQFNYTETKKHLINKVAVALVLGAATVSPMMAQNTNSNSDQKLITFGVVAGANSGVRRVIRLSTDARYPGVTHSASAYCFTLRVVR